MWINKMPKATPLSTEQPVKEILPSSAACFTMVSTNTVSKNNLINLGRQVIFFSFLSIVIFVKIINFSHNCIPTKEDLEIYQNRMFIFLSVHLSMASDYNFWYSLNFIRLNIRCSYLTQSCRCVINMMWGHWPRCHIIFKITFL